jgi:hypothetical protein
VWQQEPGSIIAFYLVGEEEWAKEAARMKLEKREAKSGKRNQSKNSNGTRNDCRSGFREA